MKISMLRAHRLAIVALLNAEKRRKEEHEREAAYWLNLEAVDKAYIGPFCAEIEKPDGIGYSDCNLPMLIHHPSPSVSVGYRGDPGSTPGKGHGPTRPCS